MMLDDGSTPIAGESVSGDLNTINRDDGGVQLTYNGWPLYYWVNDTAPGDATGHGIGGVWAAAGLEPAVFSIIPGESQVTYEVGETFFSENRFNTAIGVTTQVEGMIMGDLSNPKSVVVGPITIDISQFKSDSERRDNKIRSDFLESARYPLATFSPTQIENLPQAYAEGEQLNLRISGDLTVKETTKLAVFDVVVGYEGGTITGEAATTILMSDFGVGPISILGMLETEDEVKLEFTFVAR
jgi:polyisoprenoid-binding protein YceI